MLSNKLFVMLLKGMITKRLYDIKYLITDYTGKAVMHEIWF